MLRKPPRVWLLALLALGMGWVIGCQFDTVKDVVTGKGYIPRNAHGVPVQGEPEPRPIDSPEPAGPTGKD